MIADYRDPKERSAVGRADFARRERGDAGEVERGSGVNTYYWMGRSYLGQTVGRM